MSYFPILQKKHIIRISLVLIFFFSLSYLNAAYVSFQPHTIEQPNGDVIHCYVSGDEYFNWLHDADGYTIIQGADGYFYYGKEKNGDVVPTAFIVNAVTPSQVGLTPWSRISPQKYQQRKDAMAVPELKGSKSGPSLGHMANLVVYIRFNGDQEFTTPRSTFDARFNAPNTSSLKNYFQEVSYGNLDITSYHYPLCPPTTNLSYEDIHPRAYYEPYNATTNPIGYQNSTDRRDREHTLLVNAINHIAPQVPDTMNLDINNDGYVDNVSFIIRGGSGAWAELLWAHRWSLFSQTVYIHGKMVWDYTFQPETQSTTMILCHEMFHVVGAPDLYRYSHDGFIPVGPWDLMASGFVHMGAYMKWKYADQNWISTIPEITTSGTYTLNPLTSPTNNAYRIAVPGSSSEFFVLEYRRQEGLYEDNLPGSGLLIYRINPTAGNGNAQGPPDEVYLYRPNGTLTSNGQLNSAHFSSNTGRTQFNDYSNPPCFLSNNQLAGIEIFDITSADSTISFTFGTDYRPTASFQALPPVSCNGHIQFIDMSGKSPTSWHWDFGDGTTSTHQNPTHTYNTNGYKTVTLVVTNAYGADTLVRTNYVRIDKPAPPTGSHQESCTPTSFTLTAGANFGGELNWFEQPIGGNAIHTGDTFQTPTLTQTQTYYVEEHIPAQIQSAGAPDNNIGGGGYFNHPNTHYLVFDVHTQINLKSVRVYADVSKDRRIVVKDNLDNIIKDTTLHIATGTHRIELNFDLPPGNNYKIECLTPNARLYRSSSGTNFPYVTSGIVTIHGNSASNLSYYYYFYDWEVVGEDCISRRRNIDAAILTPIADFTTQQTGLTIFFNNTSQNTHTYHWNFDDGQTSTAINPQNTFASEGYYNVKLVAEGNCGSDTIIKNVPVFYAGISEATEKSIIEVFPNPFNDFINIHFKVDDNYELLLLNSLGQVVYESHVKNTNKYIINFNNLNSGIYILYINSKEKSFKQRLIKF